MSSNTKITHFLKEQMVLVTCEIASDTCSKPCCSDCSYWSICTLFIKQNLMHQKTVSPIISLKLKERECPCYRPPSSLPFRTQCKEKFGGPNQREKCYFVVADCDEDAFENGKWVHWDICII